MPWLFSSRHQRRADERGRMSVASASHGSHVSLLSSCSCCLKGGPTESRKSPERSPLLLQLQVPDASASFPGHSPFFAPFVFGFSFLCLDSPKVFFFGFVLFTVSLLTPPFLPCSFCCTGQVAGATTCQGLGVGPGVPPCSSSSVRLVYGMPHRAGSGWLRLQPSL